MSKPLVDAAVQALREGNSTVLAHLVGVTEGELRADGLSLHARFSAENELQRGRYAVDGTREALCETHRRRCWRRRSHREGHAPEAKRLATPCFWKLEDRLFGGPLEELEPANVEYSLDDSAPWAWDLEPELFARDLGWSELLEILKNHRPESG
ncbi:hypothetical protein HZS55_16485 [Halosimplex rubrum]|uniref:Uncharacterized protein n=1 Tax=Halosimplex rubrum TaxID=869889 RepID=A0A7D5T5U3_9EURY|nr:hypothetical protein [Halosimplex rubrum]QLH78790.1 hypothetical protein HZS55_16485 [Halosimplex rubrum]